MNLRYDAAYLLLSILIAWLLSRFGFVPYLLATSAAGRIAQSFFAGLFFTSAFTLAPASVFLASLAAAGSLWAVALVGALGAMCGDLLLFFFVRDRLSRDIKNSFSKRTLAHIGNSFHFGFLKWFAPVLGAFIIASPLPDELGLSLLGLSQTGVAVLLPISFGMNTLGILAVAAAAHVF